MINIENFNPELLRVRPIAFARFKDLSMRQVALAILFLTLLSAGCEKNPVDNDDDPPPPPEIVDHYKLYALTSGFFTSTGLALIDIPSDTVLRVVDSIPDIFTTLSITPDMQSVLISGIGVDSTVVYDADSLTRVIVLPFGGSYHFDHQRNLGLLVTPSLFYEINPSNFTLGDSINRANGYSQIDTANGVLYTTGPFGVPATFIYRYDYLTMTFIDSLAIVDGTGGAITVTNLLPVSSANRIYFYGIRGNASAAYIYNTLTKAIVLATPHDFPIGNFMKSTDGQTAYKADPGGLTTPGSGKLWKYSIPGDAISGSIPTTYQEGATTITINLTSLVMTPDGKYIYGAGGLPGRVVQIPLAQNKITHAFDPYISYFPPVIVLGKKIEP
ncbi:MAG: hypothetical protein SGI97_07365 [candidate division Zixibacteria bacterium]|nr:hypothetical protein [candidate division Zixibacteria bacterium]